MGVFKPLEVMKISKGIPVAGTVLTAFGDFIVIKTADVKLTLNSKVTSFSTSVDVMIGVSAAVTYTFSADCIVVIGDNV